MPSKIVPFKLKETDRTIWLPASNDISLFTQWYFDGWKPIKWQHQFVHAPQKKKLVVAGIRSGKTKIVAAAFLWYMMYHPNSRIANASISADQANIVYYDCLEFAQRDKFKHWIERVEKHPYPKIRLVNGAEAWFRSIGYEAELWRGHEFDLINIDECAYVPNEMAIKTLEGRLLGAHQVYGKSTQRDGQLWMTTSPKGKSWLFERWKLGDATYPGARPDIYLSLRARTFDNPAISQQALEDLMAGWTKKMIDQELNGVFNDNDGAQFSYEDVMAACTPVIRDHVTGQIVDGRPEVDDLNRRIAIYQEEHHPSRARKDELDMYELPVEKGHYYVNSWDIGKRPTKVGRNATVGGVVDITERPWKVVAYCYLAGASYGMSQERIKEWHYKYSTDAICQTAIDASGKGDIMNEELQTNDRIDVEGIVYTGSSKPLMIQSLALSLERGWIVFPFIKTLVDQLQAYEYPDDKIAQDTVMMLAQAMYIARQRMGEIGKKGSIEKAIIATSRHPESHPAMAKLKSRRQMERTRRQIGRTLHCPTFHPIYQ